MSQNMAWKLNELRSSVENIDNVSFASFEATASQEEEHKEDMERTVFEDVQEVPVQMAVTSPTSVRQVFPYITCLPFENNIVFCFVLSAWDNIVGPQAIYVWKQKTLPSQKTFEAMGAIEQLSLPNVAEVEVGEDSIKGNGNWTDSSRPTSVMDIQSDIGSYRDQHGEKQNFENCKKDSNASSLSQGDVSSDVSSSFMENNEKDVKNLQLSSDSEKEHSTPTNLSSLQEQTTNCSEVENLKNEIKEKQFSPTLYKDNACSERGQMEGKSGEKKGSVNISGENSLGQGGTQSDLDSRRQNQSQHGHNNRGGWRCGRDRLRLSSVVQYVTDHSVVVGEVGQPSEKVTTSLLVVPDQGIIIVAARFVVEEDGCGVPYCLSMVVAYEEYDYFMPLLSLVTDWLIRIAAKMRIILVKHGLEEAEKMRKSLVDLCEVLVALRSASLDQYPLVPAGRAPPDRRLAERILTSHLQTLGSTLVIADSPNAANKVIMWVAQFSPEADQHLSRLSLSYAQWPFQPGLAVQGVVRNPSGEVNLSANELVLSPRPLTLVDVTRGTVRQMAPFDVHARRRVKALQLELCSLWESSPDIAAPTESLFEAVTEASPLVKRFLQDSDRLVSCVEEVRAQFTQAFLRSLKYTALAFITWTQNEWAVQRRRPGYSSLKKALCSVFEMEEADFRIILSQAEILQPGFYSYVMS
ncbi:guanine nucleotide exchange factor C9orf72 homolog isoform X2 [Oratosquilla oratoria]